MENDQPHPLKYSVRIKGYDYAQAGAYFVTICTDQRRLFLGKIRDDTVNLDPIGEIVQSCWIGIPGHFPNINVSTFIIMPNHLHGTIMIEPVAARHAVPVKCAEDASNPAPTAEAFGKPVRQSLSTIVRSFKSAVTNTVNQHGIFIEKPLWQKGFYEHIIRTDSEMVTIGEYIQNNPSKWDSDPDNPEAVRKDRHGNAVPLQKYAQPGR